MTCTACAVEVHPYAVFPEGLCVECYAKTEEANRPLTAQDVRQMWGMK